MSTKPRPPPVRSSSLVADIMIVVDGVIPPGDFDELYAAGAAAIFPPGTVIADAAIGLLHKLAKRLGYDLT